MEKTIGYAQFLPVLGEVRKNLAFIERLAAEAVGADLLVFPELATSGYDFKDRAEAGRYAEVFGEGATSALALRLAAAHGMTIVIGYPERAGDRQYNSCLMALPDGALHNYRKIHLFSRETLLFDPGDALPPVIETPAGRIGLMICFDWVFPETARVLALAGAQIIAHPSNLVLPWCQRAMFCRCVENRVYAVTANRVGTETHAGRTLTFTGASQVVSPMGEYLVQAPVDGEHVGVARVDVSKADDKSITEFNNVWADRRTDLYGDVVTPVTVR